ncbi:MAG: FAD-dependent oxidoreductase [Bacillota bacterium]|nr:FAD-dependent oxidoreductase [Bacillota bacterium]
MTKKLLLPILLTICSLVLFGCDKEDYYSLPEYENTKLTALEDSVTPAEMKQYDEVIVTEVAVVGSDPEGVAAAVSAARNGMKTMLIDFEREKVGGLYTLGWLNMIDLNYAEKSGTESINQGIFTEILEANDNKTSFSVEKMESILNDLLTEADVTTKIDYDNDFEVIAENGNISAIVLNSQGKTILLKAAEFIDSTQNADIARAAGVEYYDGLEELGLTGERGCDTLVFQLKGVDWDVIKNHLKNDNDDNTGADNASAWGYSEITNCEISDPDIYMRGPNIGLQEDGTILLNGLQVFHMDIHDPNAIEEMRQRVITTLETELVPYMRENFEGWENVELVSVAPEFYIRESYHMKTMERLVGEDIFQSNFSDSFIACGSYSIDLQARSKGLYGIALYGTSPYGIPFGAMVSEKAANLLIASKCAGYDAIAAGSARTVPVGISLGQAAGAAAAYAIINDKEDLRTIVGDNAAVNDIRSLLNSQGANLIVREQTDLQKATANSPYYEEIKYLRGKGLLTCGYSNDYKLEEPADRSSFNSIQYSMASNSPYMVPTIDTSLIAEDKEFTADDILIILNTYIGRAETELQSYVDLGVISQEICDEVAAAEFVTNEMFYGAMANMVQYMEAAGSQYYSDVYKTAATDQ